jgi:hypothetical protein
MLHGIRDVSDESGTEGQNMHFMPKTFFPENLVYEIITKHTVEPDRS